MLTLHFPTAQAISQLLHPHGEVVIHDLKTGTIAAIYNPFSKRKVGDDSSLEESDYPDVFPVYTKSNWDGKKNPIHFSYPAGFGWESDRPFVHQHGRDEMGRVSRLFGQLLKE